MDARAKDKTKPFYDQSGEAAREPYKLEIIDWPEDDRPPVSDYSATKILFQTFLVIDGKIVYSVSWEKNSYVKDGEWQPGEYQNVKGQRATGLPAVITRSRFLGGWENYEDGKLSDPFYYDNPLKGK